MCVLLYLQVARSEGLVHVSTVLLIPSSNYTELKGSSFIVSKGYEGEITSLTSVSGDGQSETRVHATVRGELCLRVFSNGKLWRYGFPLSARAMERGLRDYCLRIIGERKNLEF